MRVCLLIAVLASLAVLTAAAPPAVDIWSAADMKQTSAELASAAEANGVEGKTLSTFGADSTAIWRRAKSGQAELHKTKTDILVIEEGEATLVYGGTIPDGKSTSLVEIRGSSIKGGITRKIGPGDVIRIPPNTPHQFVLAKGQTVSYFAVKIAR
jgi:mannose-6-phosphate isomerase-like protein (cupin superfamily)